MKTDAYFFINKQSHKYIMQSNWIKPKEPFLTQFGLYMELSKITFPIKITFSANKGSKCIITKDYKIVDNKNADLYEISASDTALIFKVFIKENDDLLDYPDNIVVSVETNNERYEEKICCEYVNIRGKITDFENNPFPAYVSFFRIAFDGNCSRLGAWSDEKGEYQIKIPKGIYNAVYVDDHTYGVTSLENWSWHFIADKDEEHDFKVGNGEVYSLSPWANNGGSATLFAYFRPMILPSIKQNTYLIDINNKDREVNDICPELELEDIKITINNIPLKVISLQKIYETSNNFTRPAYVVQFQRVATGIDLKEKQTLIVEYDTKNRQGKLGYTAQSQGRYQFFYKDSTATVIL